MLKIVYVIAALLMMCSQPVPVLAWGSITHAEINRQAAGGTCSAAFETGAHAPDMVALHHVTTGNADLDYAHNPDNEGDPFFGHLLSQVFETTKHPERYSNADRSFASGWTGHQLADEIAHGAGGYIDHKGIFDGAPNEFRSSLRHGMTELLVDAIVLNAYHHGVSGLAMHINPELIHEAAVLSYNTSREDLPRSSIITCGRAQSLAYAWEEWLYTNELMAETAASQPWFKGALDYYQDYTTFFDQSVAKVRNGTDGNTWYGTLFAPLGGTAYATEEPAETGYFTFVQEVTKRAREIGGKKFDKRAFDQALKETAKRDLAKGNKQSKVWAKLMEEMFLSGNTDFNKVISNTADYAGKTSRPAPARKSSSLYFLMPALCISIAIGALIYILVTD